MYAVARFYEGDKVEKVVGRFAGIKGIIIDRSPKNGEVVSKIKVRVDSRSIRAMKYTNIERIDIWKEYTNAWTNVIGWRLRDV